MLPVLPEVAYEGGFPSLSPDGAHLAWLRGELAPRTLCVTPVAAPETCLEGPGGTWVRWADGDTLVVGDGATWRTFTIGSGAGPLRTLPDGGHVAAVRGGTILLEAPAGTFTPVGLDGAPLAPAWTLPPRARPLLDGTGALVGALRPEVGPDPSRLDILDASGRRVARRALWVGFEPHQWRPLGVADGSIIAIDHGALEHLDLADGTRTILYSPDRGVVTDALLGPDGTPEAVGVTWARRSWTALNPDVAPELAWLAEHLDGDVEVTDRAGPSWLLRVTPGDAPAYAAVFDPGTHTLTRVPPRSPAADAWPWARVEALSPVARDGLPLTAYLTRPDPTRFPGPRPLVVSIHGGPWGARWRWGFDAEAQRLAARGWATLHVNFRGSGGHGRAFVEAARGEWAGAMRTDAYDATDSALATGGLDPARVAVMGGSYGGHATLAAAIFAPDRYRCGVALSGPPNVPWLLVGGLGRGVQLLRRADAVGLPLLMISGEADAIVPIEGIRRFSRRAAAAGRPVALATLPGEGHETSPAAWDAVSPVLDHFLATCFGEAQGPIAPSPLLHVEVDGLGLFSPSTDATLQGQGAVAP